MTLKCMMPSYTRVEGFVCGLCSVLLVASTAHAQWSVTNLHPAGADVSYAWGVNSGTQVGEVVPLGPNPSGHAAMWSGSSATWVDLHPADHVGNDLWSYSTIAACSDLRQVGLVDYWDVSLGRFVRHASAWNGSASSWVDLNPVGSTDSEAYAIHAGHVAGWATVNGNAHAGLWSGNAASWVDLNPAGAEFSAARGIHNGQQVGSCSVPLGRPHASLWSGTADSWVDLHPQAASESVLLGIHGGHQVGWAAVGGSAHAGLWSGTAQSWVDLNPAGSFRSMANAIFGDIVVGWANPGTVESHAFLWNASAGSSVDLSLLLPGLWTYTSATGVWSDGTTLYVSGTGYNALTERDEALLWSRQIPAPGVLPTLAACGLLVPRRRRGASQLVPAGARQ